MTRFFARCSSLLLHDLHDHPGGRSLKNAECRRQYEFNCSEEVILKARNTLTMLTSVRTYDTVEQSMVNKVVKELEKRQSPALMELYVQDYCGPSSSGGRWEGVACHLSILACTVWHVVFRSCCARYPISHSPALTIER